MIAVVLFTYERMEYAKKTLAALSKLSAPGESLWLHIADDGSSQEYRDALLLQGRKQFGENVSVTNSERQGYGASYNAAMAYLHSRGDVDIILPLEDDWSLTKKLDLSPIINVLRGGLFGCVRLGYIGTTQELRAKFVSAEGMYWLSLDPDSPEPHVFAGHPRLEIVEWEKLVGPWPTGMSAGQTEFAVAHRREARMGVAWPVDLVHPAGGLFVHIGTERAADAPLAEPAAV